MPRSECHFDRADRILHSPFVSHEPPLRPEDVRARDGEPQVDVHALRRALRECEAANGRLRYEVALLRDERAVLAASPTAAERRAEEAETSADRATSLLLSEHEWHGAFDAALAEQVAKIQSIRHELNLLCVRTE